MIVIKPPHSQSNAFGKQKIFLAGSIEMGLAEDWQTRLTGMLSGLENLAVLNPRRDDWDSSWEQKINNPQFNEQVTWELDGLMRAHHVVFYFDPKTKSPITLMELGLYAKEKKGCVLCPEGFWRKGNVDIVCRRFCVDQVNTLEEMAEWVKRRYQALELERAARRSSLS